MSFSKIKFNILTVVLVLATVLGLFSINTFAATSTTTLSFSKQGGIIAPGEKITVTASVAAGDSFVQMGYKWGDFNTAKTAYIYNKKATITAPSTIGTHCLHIYAVSANKVYTAGNNGSWYCLYFNVTDGSNSGSSTTEASLSILPTAGTNVAANSTIKLTATPATGTTIKQIGYRWDDASGYTYTYSSPVTINVPSTNGSHTLKVYVVDSNGNYFMNGSSKIFEATYTVGNGSSAVTTEAPVISISPSAGSNVSSGSDVKISVNVKSGSTLKQIGYRWDDASSYTYSTTSPVSVAVPSTNGSHTLKVYAVDNAGNYAVNAAGNKVHSATYNVVNGSYTDVSANLSVSPVSGSSVTAGSYVTLTASVNPSTAFKSIKYYWDNYSSYSVANSTSAKVKVPNTVGSHTLYAYIEAEGLAHIAVVPYYSHKVTYNVVNGSQNSTPVGTSIPVLSINPSSGSEIAVGSKVTLTATVDPSTKLEQIGYRWDNASSYSYSYTSPVSIDVPATAGEHTLYTYAVDKNGNYALTTSNAKVHSAVFKVKTSGSTVVPVIPTLSVSPVSGSNVAPNSNVTLTATVDSSTKLKQIGYKWDNASTYSFAYTSTVNVKVPSTSGSHTLYAYVVDENGNYANSPSNTKVHQVTYNVTSNITDPDYVTTKPVISVTPASGTIPASSNIKISIDTHGIGLRQVAYAWDSVTNPTYGSSTDFYVTAPSTAGTHYLYIYAIDNNGNYSESNSGSWYRYEFNVTDSNVSGSINSNIRTLAISLLNTDGLNKHPIDTTVKYEIVYYNGTSSDLTNAIVTFKLPYNNFKVTNYHGGTLKNSNQVVWTIPSIPAKSSGSVYIEVKCDDLSSAEKVYTFTATIQKSNNGTKYSSQLRNLFYNPDKAGRHVEFLPDGYVTNFYPNKGLTRAEFAVMCVKSAEIDVNNYESYNIYYRDVDFLTQYADYIAAATQEGYFEGYPDGKFRPEGVITRAEIATVLARKFGIVEQTPIWICFEDTEGHWAQDTIEKLYLEDLVEGYEDGLFRPDKSVSRAEGVTLLNRFLFRGELLTNKVTFKDVPTSHWAHGNVEEAAKTHYFLRTEDGNEEPVSSSYYNY